MERPLPGRSIVGRTSTRSPAIVFQQIALRWSLNPRVLFRSALDCTVLERHVSFKNSDLVNKTTYEPAHAVQLFEGSPEHIQPELELLSKPDVREITYLRRVHPQADNYPDAFDRCTIDVVNGRYTVTPDMNLSKPPLSFLYGCVHAWGLEYVPLSPEAAQKLADELVAQRLALEEKKRRAKEEKVAAANATRPAPMPCKHGLACPSKDPRHMSLFTHPDDEQRRQSWSKKTKEQSEALNAKKAKTTVESTPKTASAPLPPDQLPSAMVRMWVDYRAEYVGTNDYNTRIEGVATNFLERFTKFASREVVGGTVYEKFAHFDQLIQKEHFRTTYKRLKEKYAHWVSVFSDDKDNPIKYVYEDIGIAAHLVCLFEIDAKDKGLKEKQSFVDLGCGNGFLVHILNCEGYKGRGIDLKRRKIWDRFGPETGKVRVQCRNARMQAFLITCLIEVDFRPQDATFPDTDWLVGNHSDELTPWIPYLASKSGPRTNFFVLPCCFHDFDARFQAHRGNLGQYKTYLNYIRSIGETGGFVVETEPLRIPSTKNIALIGRTRSFDPKDPVAAQAVAVRREKLLEGKQVVHMKLRNEREAEHHDSRKRRRETVMTAAKERAGGGATDDNSNSNSDNDNDSDEADAEAGGARV